MKYDGTITRVQRSRDGVTVIIETAMGLRGIELDVDLWVEILSDFEVEHDEQVIGWPVAYDPAHGDLDVMGPEE